MGDSVRAHGRARRVRAGARAVGYVVATALLFPVAARALGSRALVRDVVAGIVFAVGVDLLFTRVLAVPLPIGIVGF